MVAVISGGTGYIGSEIARRLATDGISVAIIYNKTSSNDAKRIISKLAGKGHRVYKCDLNNPALVSNTIGKIEKEMGVLSICVHAAGTMPKQKQLHLSNVEELRKQFEENVYTGFNFLSACSTRLKEHKRGVVIGITTAGVVSQKNTNARGAYSPIKFALQGMLVSFREELSLYNVRVYSIAPGVMPGGLNRNTPRAFLDIVKEKSPTKTLAEATDVAAGVSFLCSTNSQHITNLTLLVAPESGTS